MEYRMPRADNAEIVLMGVFNCAQRAVNMTELLQRPKKVDNIQRCTSFKKLSRDVKRLLSRSKRLKKANANEHS
jgi:hypothetical protein